MVEDRAVIGNSCGNEASPAQAVRQRDDQQFVSSFDNALGYRQRV